MKTKEVVTRLPYNLQFFAEDAPEQETQETTDNPDGTDTPEQETDETPDDSVEKLMAELAAEKAARVREKNALDKALKEKAEITRKLREKQTTEEQAAEAKAEKDRQRDEELEAARKELNHMKAVAAYKDIEDEKTIELLIEAVADNDHAAIAQIIANEREKQRKHDDIEFKKNRPQLNAGNGTEPTMTKDEIMAISDPEERQAAMMRNITLFEQKGA